MISSCPSISRNRVSLHPSPVAGAAAGRFGCVCLSWGFPHGLWVFLLTTARPHSWDVVPFARFPLWNWRTTQRSHCKPIESEVTAAFPIVSRGSPTLVPAATDSNVQSTGFYLNCSICCFFLHTLSSTAWCPSYWTALTLLFRTQFNPNTSFSLRNRSNLFVYDEKSLICSKLEKLNCKNFPFF